MSTIGALIAADASASKVEGLDYQVSSLPTSMDPIAALFVELRDQVTPMLHGVAFQENRGAGSSLVVWNGCWT